MYRSWSEKEICDSVSEVRRDASPAAYSRSLSRYCQSLQLVSHNGLNQLREQAMATPVKISRAYEEVIAFIASGASPSDIVAFQPSDEALVRMGK